MTQKLGLRNSRNTQKIYQLKDLLPVMRRLDKRFIRLGKMRGGGCRF